MQHGAVVWEEGLKYIPLGVLLLRIQFTKYIPQCYKTALKVEARVMYMLHIRVQNDRIFFFFYSCSCSGVLLRFL